MPTSTTMLDSNAATQTEAETQTQAEVTTTGDTQAAVIPEQDSQNTDEASADFADFTVPDGVVLDSEALTDFKNLAKTVGLKQDQAQAFTDIAIKLSQKWAEGQQSALIQQKTEWESAARSDKEIGGDKFEENLAIAKKALEAFASDDLINLLNTTGMGSNPELIKAFYKIGKQISEDSLFGGNKTASNNHGSIAQRMYPNMNP